MIAPASQKHLFALCLTFHSNLTKTHYAKKMLYCRFLRTSARFLRVSSTLCTLAEKEPAQFQNYFFKFF